jgi:5-oxoprolinase (ATP-hydrolysing) subunit B
MTRADTFPKIRSVGLQGMLVSFADAVSESANRAALAFRADLLRAELDGVVESATSLTSVFVRFDPGVLSHDALGDWLGEHLASRDWYAEPLPEGRRFWRVPTVYGTDLAPQLGEAADLAGMSEAQAIDSLGAARVRVLTIGFAPGQPYLGPLGPEWNLPRQTELTPMIPVGALALAISQMVLFSAATPTGWRHVGQTGIRLFDSARPEPFVLRAGDELQFDPVSKAEFGGLCEGDPDLGGTRVEKVES